MRGVSHPWQFFPVNIVVLLFINYFATQLANLIGGSGPMRAIFGQTICNLVAFNSGMAGQSYQLVLFVAGQLNNSRLQSRTSQWINLFHKLKLNENSQKLWQPEIIYGNAIIIIKYHMDLVLQSLVRSVQYFLIFHLNLERVMGFLMSFNIV